MLRELLARHFEPYPQAARECFYERQRWVADAAFNPADGGLLHPAARGEFDLSESRFPSCARKFGADAFGEGRRA